MPGMSTPSHPDLAAGLHDPLAVRGEVFDLDGEGHVARPRTVLRLHEAAADSASPCVFGEVVVHPWDVADVSVDDLRAEPGELPRSLGPSGESSPCIAGLPRVCSFEGPPPPSARAGAAAYNAVLGSTSEAQMLHAIEQIVLYCTDTQRSRDWYGQVGFPYAHGHADLHWFRLGPMRIMLHPSEDGPRGAVPQLYLTTDDVDGLLRELVAKGFEPVHHQAEGVLSEPVTTPWNTREFELYDPDGHRWGFVQG
jgi:catechol 2,3-dioxygenase-like lactoylglutathione lyase family enzyme